MYNTSSNKDIVIDLSKALYSFPMLNILYFVKSLLATFKPVNLLYDLLMVQTPYNAIFKIIFNNKL